MNRPELVFFDFGGVLAEEGFLNGLHAIAQAQGKDPEQFFADVRDIVLHNGFAKGEVDEGTFWDQVRELGITGSDAELREEILSRFVLRPDMMALVDRVRSLVPKVAILSDQTNWLDELEAKYGFARYFEKVFNSFHYGTTKSEPEFFHVALEEMGFEASQALLIDDGENNVRVAREVGLDAIYFESEPQLRLELVKRLPRM
jgi:putative hydrolase of the HAD superfamily